MSDKVDLVTTTQLSIYESIYDDSMGPAVSDVTYGDEILLAIILRGPGAFYTAKTGEDWKLMWVSSANSDAELYPGFANYNAETTIDDINVVDLPSPWDSNYGIATDRLEGSRSATDTFTHEADALIYFDLTTLNSADNITLDFRKQDANNYWQLSFESDGSVDLIEVIAGTPTTRVSVASATVSGGESIAIIADDESIRVFADGVELITYASAANFKTATAGELTSLGTGGAVSDIVTWPRYLSGDALDALDTFGSYSLATPTPTPTPRYISEVPLTSGDSLIVRREFTYGDITVTLGLAGTAVLFGLAFLYRWSKTWLK